MNKAKPWILPLGLLLMVEVLKTSPAFIEAYYSTGLYPYIGIFFRKVFGRLPFSVGDLLVAMVVVWTLWKLVSFIRATKNSGQIVPKLKQGGAVLVRGLVWVYVLFYMLWGLNYYRLGSSHLLDLQAVAYSNDEVDSLVARLQHRLHEICADSTEIELAKTNDRGLLADEADKAWAAASTRFPFLRFSTQSLKPNLIGPLQSYTGYAGYMFPFTGEAHVNFFVPAFSLPFTVCHEMAHQVGFGAESEANLIGFLTARESRNKAFRYSAYSGIHLYALQELYIRDSISARAYIDSLPPLFIKDRAEQRKFYEAHRSFMQPALNAAYNLYLLSNAQPEGLGSYNYVVAWLVAYGKKYGWDSL
ncbi:MAG TPA: DUF3810 domain-containing protein [Phnomibacter sp.]|nr:DUF3810 domain-containing protein [Phnomibacter sp.]